MTPSTALKLGRVSNLPTVWSNALAGAALAGGSPYGPEAAAAALALSLAYTGGMFLNDAFDREHDAAQRPDRPIPAGDARTAEVFAWGGGLLVAALAVLALAARQSGGVHGVTAGLALAGCVLLYDAWHKGNPAAPWVMGACRLFAYLTAGLLAVPHHPDPMVAGGGGALLAYTAGVTYAARRESRGGGGPPWPLLPLAMPLAFGAAAFPAPALAALLPFAVWTARSLRRLSVGGLIAGMSLFDAAILAAQGHGLAAAAAALCFPLTIALQRRISGT